MNNNKIEYDKKKAVFNAVLNVFFTIFCSVCKYLKDIINNAICKLSDIFIYVQYKLSDIFKINNEING
jgi:hypothetical protein